MKLKKTISILSLSVILVSNSSMADIFDNNQNISNDIFTPKPPKTGMTRAEQECSIWLCLPSGFPSGCSPARSIFKDKLKRGRNPLPSWGSCSTGNERQPYSISYGVFIYENFGNNVIKRRSSLNYKGSNNISYGGGAIIKTTSTCRTTTYTQIGVYSLGWSVSNTMNDYVHFEWNSGLPLEEVRKPFTPRVVRTIHHGNGQCR